MPPTCSLVDCKRIPCALCHCCEKNLCLSHLKEHQDDLLDQLNSLVDQTTDLDDRLQAFQIQPMMDYAREKLEQWRRDCYRKIDEFFECKCQELIDNANGKLTKQRQHIDQVQTALAQLISEQAATREDLKQMKERIAQLEKDLHKMQQTSFKVDIQSYRINNDLIRIDEFDVSEFSFSSLPPTTKTIHSSKKNCAALAINETALLMHHEGNLCLFDRTFASIQKAPWSFGEISDMFWSFALKRFIIVNESSVFLVDEESMSIENIHMVAKQNWCCGTCSEKSLFLATYRRGSAVMEFNLLPSIEFVKQWKSSEICSKDEGIHDLGYFNEKLFLIIEDQVKRTIRVESRSSITFERFWSLRLDSAENQKVQIRCCPLYNDQWLVAHHDTGSLLYITADGKLEEACTYTPSPHFVCSFGTAGLVVVTSNSVHLHELSLPQIVSSVV